MPHISVTSSDIAVLLVYVLGTRIILGWYMSLKMKAGNAESYFLADRNLSWPIIGLSFYVSNMSGSTFVGLAGSGYHDGIAVFHYEWLPAVILVIFAFAILPVLYNTKIYTAPEYLKNRFDVRSQRVFSCFLLCANIFIDAAAALYAGGMIMKVLIPGIELWQSAWIISLIAGVYIIFGGLGAVVLNDTIQAFMIFAGGTAVAVMTWMRVPSWDAVAASVPERALHLIRPVSDPVMPWPGIITGVFIVGIYFWCTNQFMIQRALGARSLDHGRKGALFAGFLKLPNLFILIIPGVMAVSLYPDIERADMVFPLLAFDMMPVGLRGLMLAALAAAILSSLESIFNSAATLLTMDFLRHIPAMDERRLVTAGRWATVIFMILASLWAPQIEGFPALWQYLQSILSYVTPPVVVVFLGGIFRRSATAEGAFLTLIIGIPMGVAAWVMNEIMGLFSIQYLYACGALFAVNCVIMSAVSSVSGKKQLNDVTETAADFPYQAIPGVFLIWKDYRILSAILLIAVIFLLVWWW
ncbi:MAG TPA: sodium/solute symporter [Spirochaetota bacterium]|nr:sodium/solute symporter [Spirochaetota bacterium]